MEKVLVIAAHLDDEVLGVGGAIQRHSDAGDEVTVLNVCDRTYEARVDVDMVVTLRSQARDVARLLGVKQIFYGNQPDKYLDRWLVDTVRPIEKVMEEVRPTIVYTHHRGDVNQDHRSVHEATVVALRTFKAPFVRQAYAYEILSSTEQILGGVSSRHFAPNHFVGMTPFQLTMKQDALAKYASEVQEFPAPRSLEAIEVLAKFRGIQCGLPLAEAFETIKVVRP